MAVEWQLSRSAGRANGCWCAAAVRTARSQQTCDAAVAASSIERPEEVEAGTPNIQLKTQV
eukprot:6176486-Pleurochrysis_carterae.AAC.4